MWSNNTTRIYKSSPKLNSFLNLTSKQPILYAEKNNNNNKFRYNVQKKVNKDFTNFFIKIVWMKKLKITEVDQYKHKVFPNWFIWELNDKTLEGHFAINECSERNPIDNSNYSGFDYFLEGRLVTQIFRFWILRKEKKKF